VLDVQESGVAVAADLGAPDEAPESRGLVRPRLLSQLAAARGSGLALVIAPAGFGKTTLLAQYAQTHTGPVAWYSADPTDVGAERTALAAISAALRTTPADLLLVVDNVDCLIGTPHEAILERLLAGRGRAVHAVLAGRRMPALDLVRHEMSASSGVIGPDQLRFRTWEVERLLTTVYSAPLPPDDVALLARRTGGWAAGLAMFQLSTRNRPLAARRLAVASLSGRWAVAAEYLDRTVLSGLDPETREFLVRTSVFDVPTGERCDRLLGTTGSARILDDLAHRQRIPFTVEGGYHPLLRAHLLAALADELGEAAACRWHGRAAQLLMAEGGYAEAARCFARAGSWPAVRRLLAQVGERIAEAADRSWSDVMPGALLAEEPWLVFAEARRRLGDGQVEAAIDGFRHAEAVFADEQGRQRSRRERQIAATWLAEEEFSGTHWSSRLRAATREHPALLAAEAARLPGADGELIRRLGDLLAGNLADSLAYAAAAHAPEPESSTPVLAIRLLRAGLRLATGGDEAVELDQIAEEAESLGTPWLARVARAARALSGDPSGIAEAHAVAGECERRGDRWGAMLAGVLASVAEHRAGRSDVERLRRLVALCRALDARVPQAWVQAFLALAAVAERLPDAAEQARTAIRLANNAGVPGAHVAATLAVARLQPTEASALAREARAEAASLGVPGGVWRHWAGPPETELAVSTVERVRPVSIRCFGGFAMDIAGVAVDVSTVRARARSALRLLAMQAGRAVHREVLIDALWPDLSPAAATRNLQVTLSTLRGLLRSAGEVPLLARTDDAYSIVLPPGGYADTMAFDAAVQRWNRLRYGDDREAEIAALREALAAYGGDLLPEDGPADWAVAARERFRRQATQVAGALAAVELARGNVGEAVTTAEYCLTLDPYDDGAWQVLLRAYADGGAPAKAMDASRRYADMLAKLGIG
jgi:DNA-binding SARP family transcriptional activator